MPPPTASFGPDESFGPVESIWPDERSIDRDGLRVAFLDWGGQGPPLVLLHPNGFCAGMYHPIAARLTNRFRVLGVDLRGHGGSTDLWEPSRIGYDDMADDVLAVLDHLGVDRFRLCGVSLGGGVGIVVAHRAATRVERAMLCEAIAFPGPPGGPQAAPSTDGETNHMAVGALARSRIWPDRATVAEKYAAKGQMAELAEDVLASYVRWGFRHRADGQIELACPPETEAHLFDQGPDFFGMRQAFELLPHLDPARIHVLAGADTYLDGFVDQAAACGVELERIPGGHFFLFADPEASAELIAARLG